MRNMVACAVSASLCACADPIKIVQVDCTREYPASTYFACGNVVVTNGPAGQYREAHPAASSRFGYRFQIRNPGRPHRLVVRYPDDKTRCMAISDGTAYDMSVGVFTGAARVIRSKNTGLVQPLSNKMLEQDNIFWPRWKDASVVFANTTQGQPAAVASFEVFELDDDGLAAPAISRASHASRSFGVSFEDPCSHGSDLGANSFADWLDRTVKCMRHQGQNRLVYPLVWYHGPLYPSSETSHYFEWSVPSPKDRKLYLRWTSHPADWPEMLLERLDRENMEFVAQICCLRYASLMTRMNADAAAVAAGADTICNVWNDGTVQAGTGDWTSEYNVNNFPAQLAVREQGKSWRNAPMQYGEQVNVARKFAPIFNPAHPVVRQTLLDNVREIARRYARHPSFKGLKVFTYGSSFLAWPSLQCGYDDTSVARFEREARVRVLAPTNGAERFRARYDLLTAPPLREKWIDWRCRVVAELVEAMRHELVGTRPDLELTVQIARSRECGVDPRLWREMGVPDIAGMDGTNPCDGSIGLDRQRKDVCDVNIYNAWIEQWGRHTWWRCAAGEPEPPSMALMFGKQAEGICRMGSIFPPDGFWWPDAQMRITPAFSGGIHYMRHYANAIAKYDPMTLTRGGLTLDRAHAGLLRPFAQAFRALPRRKFKTLETTGVAVVRVLRTADESWLYLVNREYVPCDVTLHVECPRAGMENGVAPVHPAASWNVTLAPYALRSFVFPKECSFTLEATHVPPAFASDLEKRVEAALSAADAQPRAATLRKMLAARDWAALRIALEKLGR